MKRKISLMGLSIVFITAYSFVKLSSDRIGKIEAYEKSHIKNTGGAPAGKTGAPGESNCTDCHSGAVNDGTSINSLVMTEAGTTNVITQYVAGQTYDLTLAINASSTKKGFQAVALKTSDNNQAGTITAVAGSTASSTGNARTYINHTTASTGAAFFSFKWTAPSTEVGDVRFYVASNASNNAQGNSGDLIYLSQHTFSAAPVAPPIANFTVSSSQICTESTVVFTNTSTGNPTSYFWSFPGGNPSTSTDDNPNVSYAEVGTYTATLTATNSGGSTTSDAIITVVEGSFLSVGTITNTSGCGNTDGAVEINGSGTGTLSWTGFTNGSVNATLPFIANNFAAGNYTFTFDNGSGCLSNSISASILDDGAPAVSTILSSDVDNVLCEGSSLTLTASEASGLTWSTGDQTQSIEVTTAGDYFVTVTQNGCSTTSLISTVSVISCVSLAENNAGVIVLYPNPSSNQLSVKNIDLNVYQHIQLIDLKGKLISTWKISNSEENINLETIEKGSYFIKVIGVRSMILKPITKF